MDSYSFDLITVEREEQNLTSKYGRCLANIKIIKVNFDFKMVQFYVMIFKNSYFIKKQQILSNK